MIYMRGLKAKDMVAHISKSSKGGVFLHKANWQEEEFLCHFIKTAEFGTFPEIGDPVMTLLKSIPNTTFCAA